MKKRYLFPLACLLSLPALADTKAGGFFIEPMLTYERGVADIDWPAPLGDSKADVEGFGAGARVGVHVMESLFIGADGRYSRNEIKDDESDTTLEGSAYNWGPVVGLQMPTDLGIRVWAGYIMGGANDLDEKDDIDLKLNDGKGHRLGAGIKLGPVSLNAEYQHINYDDVELQDSPIFTGSTDSIDTKVDSYVFSVSFPIAL